MWRQLIRSLARSPWYTATAVTILGLIAGASATAFSMLYGVLLRPALFEQAESVVVLESGRARDAGTPGEPIRFSLPEFRDWAERSRGFSDLAIFRSRPFSVGFESESRLLAGASMSDRFFQTVREPLLIGRPPVAQRREVVISEELWRSQLGGSPAVLGEFVEVEGTPYAIVGVVPAGLRFLEEQASIWAPIASVPAYEDRNNRPFTAVGRLTSGTALAQAQADADRVSGLLALEYPDTNEGVTVELIPLLTWLTEPVRDVLLLIATAVAVMLIAGMASLANLVTLRDGSRAPETATRAALGAPPWRRLAEAAAEHAPIALGGASLGWLVWRWTVLAASPILPAGLAVEEYTRTSGAVVISAIAASGIAMTGALLLSAAAAAGLGTCTARTPDARSGRRIQTLIRMSAVVQVALSVVLVYAAVLLNSSLQKLRETDIGISNRRVLSTFVDMRDSVALPTPQQAALVQRLVDSVTAVPGVDRAAASYGVPPDQLWARFGFPQVDETTGTSVNHTIDLVPAGPGYFELLGIPLVHGRFFDERDHLDNEPVVILSITAARRFFGEEQVAGRMLDGSLRRVAGVVGNVPYRGVTDPSRDVMYFPTGQFSSPGTFILADGVGDSLVSAGEVARVIRDVDPSLPIGTSAIVGDPGAGVIAIPTVRVWAVAALAVLALVQTVVALYGAAAYSGSRRMREYAIRMALGATRLQIAGTAVIESAWQAAAGLVLGLGSVVLIGRSMAGVLEGAGPTALGPYAVAAAVVAVVAIGAAAGPAWRAASGDPAAAFRAD